MNFFVEKCFNLCAVGNRASIIKICLRKKYYKLLHKGSMKEHINKSIVCEYVTESNHNVD